MEFISAEEFEKQDKKVQKVFLDWWKPSIGDLFAWNDDENYHDMHEVNCCSSKNMVDMTVKNKGVETGKRIPLLTEGQLRKFIEDKYSELDMSKVVVELEYYSQNYINNNHTSQTEEGYCMQILDSKSGCGYIDILHNLGNDLLKAYWKIAVQIAEQL